MGLMRFHRDSEEIEHLDAEPRSNETGAPTEAMHHAIRVREATEVGRQSKSDRMQRNERYTA
jgi:hypothetical protein